MPVCLSINTYLNIHPGEMFPPKQETFGAFYKAGIGSGTIQHRRQFMAKENKKKPGVLSNDNPHAHHSENVLGHKRTQTRAPTTDTVGLGTTGFPDGWRLMTSRPTVTSARLRPLVTVQVINSTATPPRAFTDPRRPQTLLRS